MFETILCPVDSSVPSRRAVAAAADVAYRFDARLVVLTSARDITSPEAKEVIDRAVSERREAEAEYVIDTERDPVDAIVAAAEAYSRPLVCMSTHGRRGLARHMMGSTAEAAVRRLAVPILLVGPAWDGQPDPGGNGLVVALDGSEIGESIIPVAAAWAGFTGVSLTLVEVLDASIAEGSSRESYVEEQVRLIRRHHPSTQGVVLRDPDPASAVAAYADREDLKVVAMATRAYRGLARLTAGSVTMDVVRATRHPVLVVSP